MYDRINEINTFIRQHLWCDFSIISWSQDFKIGGTTSFTSVPDIIITFKDVFFVQCLSDWKTDTNYDSFIMCTEEEGGKDINLAYGVEQGYTVFKIIGEDLNKPMYVCARGINYEIVNLYTQKR